MRLDLLSDHAMWALLLVFLAACLALAGLGLLAGAADDAVVLRV